MYGQVGEKLKVCAYIFMILFILKSICLYSCKIFTVDGIWNVLNDCLFAFFLALFIYGYSYVVCIYENKCNLVKKDQAEGGQNYDL